MIPSSSSLSPPQSLVLYYHETWKQSIFALHHFMKSKQEIGNPPPQQAQSQSVCQCLSWSCSSRLTATVDLTRSRSKPQSSEQHFISNPPTTRPTIIFLPLPPWYCYTVEQHAAWRDYRSSAVCCDRNCISFLFQRPKNRKKQKNLQLLLHPKSKLTCTNNDNPWRCTFLASYSWNPHACNSLIYFFVIARSFALPLLPSSLLPPSLSLSLSLSSRRRCQSRPSVRPSVRLSDRRSVIRKDYGTSIVVWLPANGRERICVLLTAGRQWAAEKAFQTTRAPWYGSDAQECPHVIKGAPHIPERYTNVSMDMWIPDDIKSRNQRVAVFSHKAPVFR